jgi:hypothetical protein
MSMLARRVALLRRRLEKRQQPVVITFAPMSPDEPPGPPLIVGGTPSQREAILRAYAQTEAATPGTDRGSDVGADPGIESGGARCVQVPPQAEVLGARAAESRQERAKPRARSRQRTQQEVAPTTDSGPQRGAQTSARWVRCSNRSCRGAVQVPAEGNAICDRCGRNCQ